MKCAGIDASSDKNRCMNLLNSFLLYTEKGRFFLYSILDLHCHLSSVTAVLTSPVMCPQHCYKTLLRMAAVMRQIWSCRTDVQVATDTFVIVLHRQTGSALRVLVRKNTWLRTLSSPVNDCGAFWELTGHFVMLCSHWLMLTLSSRVVHFLSIRSQPQYGSLAPTQALREREREKEQMLNKIPKFMTKLMTEGIGREEGRKGNRGRDEKNEKKHISRAQDHSNSFSFHTQRVHRGLGRSNKNLPFKNHFI